MFVVTWNKEQCDWIKIETLDEHIKANLSAFVENRLSTFLCLGVFPTREAADQAVEKLIKIRDSRSALSESD